MIDGIYESFRKISTLLLETSRKLENEQGNSKQDEKSKFYDKEHFHPDIKTNESLSDTLTGDTLLAQMKSQLSTA